MIPMWRWPTPRVGAKSRDAGTIETELMAVCPDVVVCGFAGGASELEKFAGMRVLVLAEPDPAIRAVWTMASRGKLASLRRKAIDLWGRQLRRAKGDPRAAWNRLREREPQPLETGYSIERHAVWCLVIGAGADLGRWRRNNSGGFNIPYFHTYDPAAVAKRLRSVDELRAADEWALLRKIVIFEDYTKAVGYALSIKRKGPIAFLFDPPYGKCERQLYGGGWGPSRRDELIVVTVNLLKAGHYVAAWCGVEDVASWQASTGSLVPYGMQWTFRPARTAMKAARNGQPARTSKGGHIGLTRRMP